MAESSLLTSVPDIGTWHSGSLNTVSRCFDVMCCGNCELGSSDQKLKLDFQSAGKIPDFFAKNSNGKIIFSEPKPMTTILAPKGHKVWLKIDLVRIDGQFSNAEKYVCLGIKKHSEDECFDILHIGNRSRFVDVMDGDPVDLVPLLSSTDVASEVTLVVPGEQITPANFGVSGDSFDFGSVYRINTEVQEGQWVTETYKLGTAEDNWDIRSIGVGEVVSNKNNQLIAITSDESLACSSDGIYWRKLSTQFNSNMGYIAHGNGVWCAIGMDPPDNYAMYSTDNGKSWENSSISDFRGTRAFTFGNGKFMTISERPDNFVFVSVDGIFWNKVGIVPNGGADSVRSVCYGNNMWLGINGYNIVYRSKDGITWEKVNSSGLSEIMGTLCFASGHFYMSFSQSIMRSIDGEKWEEVVQLSGGTIVYYKSKLYVFRDETCHIGFPNP